MILMTRTVPSAKPDHRFPAARPLNGLLCMFNGFAIPKPFCRTINAYSRVGESVRLSVGSAGLEIRRTGGFAEGGTA
jgi:hypothetical protein